nr:hypothetical protein [Tanacetum cinerariifolium]
MSFFNESEDDQLSSWTSPFFTNQVFGTREEMMDWAKTTAYSLGYVLVTQRSKKYKNGFIWKVHLMCDRSVDRTIFIIARLLDIRMVCDQHNHLPTQNLEGHAYARRLSDDEYHLVEDLTWKNVRPREILSTLRDPNENNLSTLSTIYDAQHKIRKVENAGKTPMQVLMSLLHINRYVYEPFINPVTNELQALFFVHSTSYEIWRAFSHVLIIDATYKTNIYKMSFVQIVGVTLTGKTFCIAFVFISEEKTDNYKWALEQLKLTLNECMSPRVIVTDRELALMKACEIVFPQASRLLCRWHIGQNIVKNCKQTIRSWKLLEDSPKWISYTENCEKLQTFLSKYPRVLKYVHDNWLDKYKQHFVSAWIDRSLNFGNRATNRVESQHVKLKDYMTCHNYTLDKFVFCIDKIVKSQLTAINESFGISEISRYHKHNIPCFSLIRGVVSNEALDLMVKETERSNGFQLDSSTCGCQLHNSCGLPCACRLALYVNSGEFIPLDSIDIFWRTLNLSPATKSYHLA